MANPIWLTGQGKKTVDLGTVTEGSYFEYPLDSYDPLGGPVSYKFLAGSLPPGIRISSNSAISSGYIQGGPYLNTVENVSSTYEFSVRATDQQGLVADKSFTMSIANVNPPVIVQRVTDLGEIFDGEYFSLQLTANELNPNAVLTWTLSAGSLPPGVTLTSDGLVSGFVTPLNTYTSNTEAPNIQEGVSYIIESIGTTDFTDFGASDNIVGLSFVSSRFGTIFDGTGTVIVPEGFNSSPYNEFAYENSPTYQENSYQFTIRVFDGLNYDSLTYSLSVVSKGSFTADSTLNTIDTTYFTIDSDNVYNPIMLTPSQTLPEVRSHSKFAFQFQGLDPNGNQLNYALSLSSSGSAGFDQDGTVGFDTTGFDQQNLSVPPGLTLDPTTGWLSGSIGAQVAAVQEYNFQVYCYEVDDTSLRSAPVTYNMTILGDITNTITWNTQANLGVIDNGTLSQLSVSATNNSGRELTYALISDGSRLPQGLELQSSGLITGRTGFEFFSIDGGDTTIDGIISPFDNSYQFIVKAFTKDGTASSEKTFNVLINNFNLIPYEDVYLKALPSLDQRNLFLSIVNNEDIFPSSLIYRPSDPNFGRARDIRSLFISGLSPTEVADYLSLMGTNTYNKRVEFSNVKTAIAVDQDFKTKYEVVYIELKDDASFKGKTPANSFMDTVIDRTIYPNSFANMRSVIVSNTGFANPNAIPEWMSSPQADKRQLGFTRAVVLAYTVPGASKLIAYRLGANGITFNSIDFVVDRYDLDNSYTANYNIADGDYDLGRETTFDRIIRPGVVTASASYGVTDTAFNMIHNQTVAQINARGGLDGVTTFQDGDTLVFLQQEGYSGEAAAYDGWVDGSDIVPGWLENVNSTKIADGTAGFPLAPEIGQVALVSNTYYMFSSDLDSDGNFISNTWKIANLRANIWTINITGNLVTLTPAFINRKTGGGGTIAFVRSMITIFDRVQINYGVSHSESVVFYDPVLSGGNSVPAYSLIPTLLNSSDNDTHFDGNGTRFINNRISHQRPEEGDVWLKFPNTGPLG